MSSLNSDNKSMIISVGARSSPLSQVQVQEILSALKQFHHNIKFNLHLVSTTGDLDQKTSLRTLDKTNFFTKEVDDLILQGKCRIGIHSAKDLPFPLPNGLVLICLTKSLDPSDSLVLRQNETLQSLPKEAKIATSSYRREQMVQELRSDLTFIDLRGTIEQRLSKLESREADGVVIAEAALIRLNLTHLNRIKLPGKGADGQGQLAVLAKDGDTEMRQIFASINKI